MGLGQSYATDKNDPYAGEKGLHILNTRDRGKARDFWMFNPEHLRTDGDRACIAPLRCGVCKTEIPKGKRHCPHCWGEEE